MKKAKILLPLLLVLSLLAACGATAQPETADTAANAGAYEEVATEDTMTEVPEAAPAEGETASTEAQSTSGITEGTATEGDLSERIIYSAYAEIETTDFDASLEVVYDLLDQYDAFVENSSVNGSNLYDTYSGTVSPSQRFLHPAGSQGILFRHDLRPGRCWQRDLSQQQR